MTTKNNITNSTVTINHYFSTSYTHEPKGFIPTKACNLCHQIIQLTEFYKCKPSHDGNKTQC